MTELSLEKCNLCPRNCNIDRTRGEKGFCHSSDKIFVAKRMLHKWEEPPISGKKGAGTVFFSGCNLKCRYCQNYSISRNEYGREYDTASLSELFLEIQNMGAETLDLVTPTHYALQIKNALERIQNKLNIPVVWNSGGYEKKETVESLSGLVDVYLPDAKYFSSTLSKNFSAAENYFDCFSKAVVEMYNQVGEYKENENGTAEKGVIIRHMVLPSHREDSIALLHKISEILPTDKIRLSLMCQYTPYNNDDTYQELNRRLTTFEYNKVVDTAEKLGYIGFTQERTAAKEEYTPDFSEF